ncbi:hypothetical protein K2173_006602 [Erythroxylum novogranatense]|uniref:RING-CH-type domain-containing protein n=1 Tax=Erythroxylum novogranatense TaxID=1862640 RepID=A0AAV8T706_9ROSI|nr:hypothetical protein K2173_006602 [Erythroxylum novogranatense]
MGTVMEEETGKNKGIHSALAQLNQELHGNSGKTLRNSGNGCVLEAEAVLNSGEVGSGKEERGILDATATGLGSTEKVEKQETSGMGETGQPSNQGTSRNPDDFVIGIVLESVTAVSSRDTMSMSVSREKQDLGEKSDEFVSTGRLKEQETSRGPQNGETMEQIEQGVVENLSTSIDGVSLETAIAIDSAENAVTNDRRLETNSNEFGSTKMTGDKSKAKSPKVEKPSVIDFVGRGESKDNRDGETVCRICHLNSEVVLESGAAIASTAASGSASASTMDLIQLGCGCKNELGIAHSHCAEAWFKLKQNRICEICGEMAKNVTDVGDSRFVEEWNHVRLMVNGNRFSDRGGGCWRGQPFCNFLMACLVVAFILPLFFRVDLF